MDGQEVAHAEDPAHDPVPHPADETFDVGVDTRTGVNDLDYKRRSPSTARSNKLTFKLGPTQLTEIDHRRIRKHAIARD